MPHVLVWDIETIKDTRFIEVTVGNIEQALDTFEDVETELFKIRRQIERGRP
jgi:hypothetical protein